MVLQKKGKKTAFCSGDTAAFKTWYYSQGILQLSADYTELDFFDRITKSWIPNAEQTVVNLYVSNRASIAMSLHCFPLYIISP